MVGCGGAMVRDGEIESCGLRGVGLSVDAGREVRYTGKDNVTCAGTLVGSSDKLGGTGSASRIRVECLRPCRKKVGKLGARTGMSFCRDSRVALRG